MNKTIMAKISLLLGGIITATLLTFNFEVKDANAAIIGSMDLGSTGSNVRELQMYLATDPTIYPSGLVTGYFGQLTKAAVERFQTAQGIVSSGTPSSTGYGRVGPLTLAKINALMGSGNQQTTWDTVPILSTPSVQFTNTTATISWTTNEPTKGQVYWDTSTIRADEATGPNQQPFISGALATDSGGLQASHTVTISNLQANTLYYYLIRSIDSAGNMSITWPPGTFRTTQ